MKVLLLPCWTCAQLGWILKMAVPSSQGGVKILPSFKNPRFQNEAKCTTFLVKISFICMRMKNHFHIKGRALNLVLIQRPRGTRKYKTKEERLILQSGIYTYFYQYFGRQAQPCFFGFIFSLIADQILYQYPVLLFCKLVLASKIELGNGLFIRVC